MSKLQHWHQPSALAESTPYVQRPAHGRDARPEDIEAPTQPVEAIQPPKSLHYGDIARTR